MSAYYVCFDRNRVSPPVPLRELRLDKSAVLSLPVPPCPPVSLKENDYEQRRSQVRVLPSAPHKYLQNAGTYEGPTLVSDLCTPFATRARILYKTRCKIVSGPASFTLLAWGCPPHLLSHAQLALL